jgi:hypothetical protein
MMPKRTGPGRPSVPCGGMGVEARTFPEQAAAEWALRWWATANQQRDELIRLAVAAGVDTGRIQQITGVARATITRITQGEDA